MAGRAGFVGRADGRTRRWTISDVEDDEAAISALEAWACCHHRVLEVWDVASRADCRRSDPQAGAGRPEWGCDAAGPDR
jgi:transposase